MAQARAPARIVNNARSPHAVIVAPAMLNALKHRADARIGVRAYQSGNAAHRFNLTGDENFYPASLSAEGFFSSVKRARLILSWAAPSSRKTTQRMIDSVLLSSVVTAA
jgi:hypothetical protein